MISKKIFTIDAIFNLPDDFDGDWRDALELYAEYVKQKRDSGSKFEKLRNESIYDTLFKNDSTKHVAKITIQEWNGYTWENKKHD